VIENKVKSDTSCARGSIVERQTLPDFAQNHLLSQYGVKSVAKKNIQQFAQGIRKYADGARCPCCPAHSDCRLVTIFGKLSGVLETTRGYSSMTANFIMDMLESLFGSSIGRISDALLKNGKLSITLVQRALDNVLIAYECGWSTPVYKKLFRKIDADKSGCIDSTEELGELLHVLGYDDSPEEVSGGALIAAQ
jgi:hypothetical protein